MHARFLQRLAHKPGVARGDDARIGNKENFTKPQFTGQFAGTRGAAVSKDEASA
jgi:hypothetical protein